MRKQLLLIAAFLLLTGYRAHDLGTLPGGSGSGANAINERGDVAGSAVRPGAPVRAVVWPVTGGIVEIPTPMIAGTSSGATGINSRGIVVGSMAVAPTKYHAFLWNGTTLTDIHTWGENSGAWAVNKMSDIGGAVSTPGPPLTGFATVWPRAASPIPLPSLGGFLDRVEAVSEAPVFAGTSELQKSGQRAALWVFGTVLDLGTLGGPQSFAHGLLVRHWPDPHLNHVYVVGESEMPTGGYLGSHAFVYNRGTMTDLGMPPGFINARAYGINRRQEIVGYATDATGTFHAMLWRRGRIYDLNTLVEPGSTCRTLLIAYAINDRGEIAGYGDCKGGGAFKLTP